MIKPMLAVNAEVDKIKFPVYASPKLDGIRCIIIDGVPKTRTLKDIPNKHVAGLLTNPAYDGLDGELIVGDPTSPTVYRDTTSEVMSHDKKPYFHFYAFDIHNIEGDYPYRKSQLDGRFEFDSAIFAAANIIPLESVLIETERSLMNYEAVQVEKGYEGIIVRGAATGPYKYGRSTMNEQHLMKVKRFEDSEAEIIGFEEEMFNGNEAQTNELGRTKRSTAKAGLVGKETLGAFRVRDVQSGVEFSIGTGITAAERRRYWDFQDSLVGGLVKYKYFPVGIKVAPRHPVFLGFRSKSDL
jgi:DNA ligase-1